MSAYTRIDSEELLKNWAVYEPLFYNFYARVDQTTAHRKVDYWYRCLYHGHFLRQHSPTAQELYGLRYNTPERVILPMCSVADGTIQTLFGDYNLTPEWEYLGNTLKGLPDFELKPDLPLVYVPYRPAIGFKKHLKEIGSVTRAWNRNPDLVLSPKAITTQIDPDLARDNMRYFYPNLGEADLSTLSELFVRAYAAHPYAEFYPIVDADNKVLGYTQLSFDTIQGDKYLTWHNSILDRSQHSVDINLGNWHICAMIDLMYRLNEGGGGIGLKGLNLGLDLFPYKARWKPTRLDVTGPYYIGELR